jgi:hypothetical protein
VAVGFVVVGLAFAAMEPADLFHEPGGHLLKTALVERIGLSFGFMAIGWASASYLGALGRRTAGAGPFVRNLRIFAVAAVALAIGQVGETTTDLQVWTMDGIPLRPFVGALTTQVVVAVGFAVAAIGFWAAGTSLRRSRRSAPGPEPVDIRFPGTVSLRWPRAMVASGWTLVGLSFGAVTGYSDVRLMWSLGLTVGSIGIGWASSSYLGALARLSGGTGPFVRSLQVFAAATIALAVDQLADVYSNVRYWRAYRGGDLHHELLLVLLLAALVVGFTVAATGYGSAASLLRRTPSPSPVPPEPAPVGALR